MSDIIQLLPDSVANQIAAGEVIQRPASVIKELVENSIDAGATEIKVILKDAGRTLIQIIDNGVGMSATDARLAFERHATSKIRKSQDLFSLRTMGFRGEALASIAAIAQVELKTQRAEDQMGTHLIISGSKCESQEPVYYGKGSNFMVKNIFYNVPARRKFLKNNQIELSHILREFEKIALFNSEIEFTLVSDDRVLHQLEPGNLKKRIVSLFGKTFESQLIPVSVDTSLINIEGYVCRPENARKKNQEQFFFVNGRYMRHPYFHKAVVSCYDQLIPGDQHPNYFICLKVDPETIDVNIHPAKTEIKFENEQSIWAIISAAVKETLGKFSVAPSIDFDTEGAPEIPVFTSGTELKSPEISLDTSYNPFQTGNNYSKPLSYQGSYKASENPNTRNWESLYDSFIGDKNPDDSSEFETVSSSVISGDMPVESDTLFEGQKENNVCLQVKGRYILSQVKSGLMIIDQHRAHVLVLFDKFISQKKWGSVSSQRIIFPETLHLSVEQNLVLEKHKDDIQTIGFDLSDLGGNVWAVNSVPSGVPNLNIQDTLMNLIEMISNGEAADGSELFEKIALVVAQKAAIPYGKILTSEEMDNLQSGLLQLQCPNYTPDGKIVIKMMPIDSINKLFA